MKIAAAQTTSIWAGPTNSPVEPAPLVGMDNLLRAAGHDARIIHNTTGCQDDLLRQIDEFGPDIVGLSSSAMSPKEGIDVWSEPISALKAQGVTVLMGGKGPTVNTQQYAEEANPDVIVLGPGEPIIATFIQHGFDWNALKREPIFKGVLGNTLLFGIDDHSAKHLNLDEVGYKRDYDLTDYGLTGWPYLQIGCPHKCIFCPGDYTVQYKSPQLALEEVRYLVMEKGALIIWPLGSDFTASANRSSAIVEALIGESFLSTTAFRFEIRLDSFRRALRRHTSVWERFASSVPVLRLNSGVESLLGERRWRMRKDFTEERAMQHTAVVDEVLAWARKMGNVVVEGSMIMLDPENTFDEFHRELSAVEERVRGGAFWVVPGMLHNTLTATIGTPSIDMYPPPKDMFYKNDPRVTFLGLYLTYACQRDYDDATAACGKNGIEDNIKATLFIINRLREVAQRIERKVPLGTTGNKIIPVYRQLAQGDFSFFDEG